MSYSCKLYTDTGFNSCNIPDSPSLVGTAASSYVTVPALDILQDRHLDQIKVKATWNQVKDVDYCVLDDEWYYFVNSVTMLATDVAMLSVETDYITSGGGISQFEILDGVTERVHVSKANDLFGAWTEEDPLLTPCQELRVTGEWHTVSGDDYTLIESTLNPMATNFAEESKVYYDNGDPTSDLYVTVPQVAENENKTAYSIASTPVAGNGATCVYGGPSSSFPTQYGSSFAALRSLGLEQAVLRQVNMNTGFVDITQTNDSSAQYNYSGTQTPINYTYVSALNGKDVDITLTGSHMDFENSLAENNRINYSSFQKYGLVTCSGESMESNPAALRSSSDLATSPTVRMISDPHLDGKPYYRFKKMNGDDSQGGFWRNCAAGLPWKESPLLYTGASGSALNTIKYENEKAMAVNSFTQGQKNYKWDQIRNAGTMALAVPKMIAGGVGAAMTGGLLGAEQLMNGAAGMLNAEINMLQSSINNSYTKKGFQLSQKSELSNLEIANTVVVPTVNFPFNSEAIRDLKHNGVYVYRYYYTDADIARIDRLLEMYGYRVTKALRKTDFSTRDKFNFVKCSTVSLGGNARWLNEGAAEQLKNGVRVWHVTPDHSYYAPGSNV